MSSEFILLKNKVLRTLQSEQQIVSQNIFAINPKNAMDLIVKTMSIVDSYYKNSKIFPGESKKQLVLNLVYDIINTSGATPENKAYIIDLINNVFDPLIENIIDITKGNTDINKKTNFIVSLFNRCIHKNSTI
jgi:hypothetical protein